MMELLAARLILALLQDDPCERTYRVRVVREESGLDPSRFLLALATAEEAASWWRFRPDSVEVGRDLLTARILELEGVLA